MHISIAPAAAAQYDLTAVLTGHICDNLTAFGFFDHRTLRYSQNNIFSVCTMATTLSARFAVLRRKFSSVTVLN